MASRARMLLDGASSDRSQKRGGTSRIYNSSNPPSALPHEDATMAVVMPFMAVYNNLVRFDPAEPAQQFRYDHPELATTWEWDVKRPSSVPMSNGMTASRSPART